jgi:hypothetical protein
LYAASQIVVFLTEEAGGAKPFPLAVERKAFGIASAYRAASCRETEHGYQASSTSASDT